MAACDFDVQPNASTTPATATRRSITTYVPPPQNGRLPRKGE